ncbi:hypothetical protein EUX98_g4126 [Antrodiella citrinella]|uniref:Uncharacterized protein n=1 Tax=Antrodiella citrinella TaxID=2447956 RepID=A0A4S4MUX4_9APHY|nr:hypothetical protein EUX98_g4126 [Antrodiella citrinella]
MQDQELGLIAVDAINAFYWTDRFTMEQLRGGSLDFNVSTPLFHVATAFQRLRLSHAPVIVITTRDLVAASKNMNVEGVPVIPSSRQHLYPFLIPAVKISGPSHAVGPDVTMTGTLSEVDVKPVLPKVPARPQTEVHLPLAFHIKLHPTSTMCIPIASVVGTRLEAGAHVEEGSVLVRGPTGLSIGTFSLSILPDKVLISPGAG